MNIITNVDLIISSMSFLSLKINIEIVNNISLSVPNMTTNRTNK